MPGMEAALEVCLARGLTFVAFRWNKRTQIWVQKDPNLLELPIDSLDPVADHFVIAQFRNEGGTVHLLKPYVQLFPERHDLDLHRLESCTGATHQGIAPPVEWDQESHASAIRAAQHAFGKGELRKVVLARTCSTPIARSSLTALFMAALDAHPDAFVCLLNCAEHGTWLGASPERLVSCEAGAISVDAIAGTHPADRAPQDPLDWGAKERDEQELVTHAIVEVLQAQPVGPITRTGPEVFRAGPVAHLRTRLSAPLASSSLASLVHELHPTPAVNGTPREAALDFIHQHEPHDRGLYAGYWGPWNVNGRTELFVNIRCLEVLEDSASIHVGGGITAGSNAADEWCETEAKARTWTDRIEAVNSRIP